MIKQQDAVGLTLFDKKINYSVPARSKISHLNVLLNTLHNSSINGETNIKSIDIKDDKEKIENEK